MEDSRWVAATCSPVDIVKLCHKSVLPWALQQVGIISGHGVSGRSEPPTHGLAMGYCAVEEDSGSTAEIHTAKDEATDTLQGNSVHASGKKLSISPLLIPCGMLRRVNVHVPAGSATISIHSHASAPALYQAPEVSVKTGSATKLSYRRAQAANELVASEATYVGKLVRLVGVFVQPLAPKQLDVPSMPEEILGHSEFGIPQAVADLLEPKCVPPVPLGEDHAEPFADSVSSKAQAGRVRQLVRYSSSGSKSAYTSSERGGKPRRFSWLGGAKDSHSLISSDVHNRLFRDVHSLLTTNFELLSGLQDALRLAQGAHSSAEIPCRPLDHTCALEFRVGELLLAFSSDLLRYSTYVSNYSTAISQLSELKQTDAGFVRWLNAVEADATKGQGHTLESFLILPVQRVPRYSMLLRAVLKYTPDGHADQTLLRESITAIESAAATINDAISLQHPLLELEAALHPPPSPAIVAPGQHIVRTGWLSKLVSESIRSSKEYFFVQLQDRLLYASIEKANDTLLKHRDAYIEQVGNMSSLQVTLSADGSELLQAPEVVLPCLPVSFERVKLHLHNCLKIHRLFEPTNIDGRITMQLEADPKPVLLVFRSWAEALVWYDSLKSIVQAEMLQPLKLHSTPTEVQRLRRQSVSATSLPTGKYQPAYQAAEEGAAALLSTHSAGHDQLRVVVPEMATSLATASLLGELVPITQGPAMFGVLGPGTPVDRVGGICLAGSQHNPPVGQVDVFSLVRKYITDQHSKGDPVMLTVLVA